MAKASVAGTQTSRKAGVASTAKKMDSSHNGFKTEPPSRQVGGAFGEEGRGSKRQPGTQTSKKGAAAALGALKTAPKRPAGSR